MNDVELVHVIRGGMVDCVHHGCVAVTNVDGELLFAAGDADDVVFLRSSAKPFQALAAVRSGAVDHFDLSVEELAIIAGSHTGRPNHTQLVTGILHKIGAEVSDLQCGASPPLDNGAGHEFLSHGGHFSALHHNCSGKHSGMLAACRVKGWDIETYHHVDHPLQVMNREAMAEFAGMDAADIVIALDGCGVPTFGLPLRNIALMFARLGAASRDENVDLGRVGRAMQAYPYTFSGPGQVDATMMVATESRLVAKGGAEGLMSLGVSDQDVGIALKVRDGSTRAHVPALAALMLARGYMSQAEHDAWLKLKSLAILNNRGEQAGELRSVLLQ
jgi:L-asparaginase II